MKDVYEECEDLVKNFKAEPLKSLPHYLTMVIRSYLKMIEAIKNSHSDPKNINEYWGDFIVASGFIYTLKRIEDIKGDDIKLMANIQILINKHDEVSILTPTIFENEKILKNNYSRIIKILSEIYFSYVDLLLVEVDHKGWLREMNSEEKIKRYSFILSSESNKKNIREELNAILIQLFEKFIFKKGLS